MKAFRLLSFLLFLLGLPAAAQAWVPLDSCWGGNYTAWAPGSPHTVWKFASNFPSDDFSQAQTIAILEDSFEEWGAPGCSTFSVARGSDTTADPLDNNSDSAVGFYEDSWPWSLGSALAVTFMSWDGDCEMNDASMVFNAYDYSWVDGSWGNDLQSVATHEAGHWVGLDHSSWSDSTMTAYYNGGIGDRVLSCDDTEAACTLYPSGGTACGAPGYDEYCPCGESCVSGWCEGTPSGDPWGGDDDDAVPSDDDDVSGDDDDAAPPSGNCSGPPEFLAESEPNDWDGSSDYDSHAGAGGDVTLTGTVACASSWAADVDWFVVDFPCEDSARFTMDWSGNSDLDFWVYDADEELLVENMDEDYWGPVMEQGFASGQVMIAVSCWTGPSVEYSFDIDFAPWGWTPPAGDDDDAAPGDDDDDGGDETEDPVPEPPDGGDPGDQPEDGVDEDLPTLTQADQAPYEEMGCGCGLGAGSSPRSSGLIWGLILLLLSLRRKRN